MKEKRPIYERPNANEYDAFYEEYVSLVEGDPVVMLERIKGETLGALGSVSEEQAGVPHQAEKWSVKEWLGHLAEVERVMAFRALWFARGGAPLPGYDHEEFAAMARHNERALRELIDDYLLVRDATVSLFRGLPTDAALAKGALDGVPTSVRALAHIVAGHERRHLDYFKKRYLGSPDIFGDNPIF
jgi:hypothetical protein